MAAQPLRPRGARSPNRAVIQATPIWDEELRSLKRPNANGSQLRIETRETEEEVEPTPTDHRYRN
jgi:hypothetical protein